MKLTSDIMSQVKAIVDEHGWEYEKYAIRIQEVPFELGKIDHVSHVWVDGDETEDKLSGLCCTMTNCMEQSVRNGEYFGNYMAVIGGNSYEYGEDIGEIIISDPVVIAIIA